MTKRAIWYAIATAVVIGIAIAGIGALRSTAGMLEDELEVGQIYSCYTSNGRIDTTLIREEGGPFYAFTFSVHDEQIDRIGMINFSLMDVNTLKSTFVIIYDRPDDMAPEFKAKEGMYEEFNSIDEEATVYIGHFSPHGMKIEIKCDM